MIDHPLKVQQPRLFEEFCHIIRSGRMGHAYLFTGSFGSLEMAIFLAQSRFCASPLEGLPCQTCRSCRLITQKEFSDLRYLTPTNGSIKTDLVREVLQDFAQSGFETDHQVLIIEGAEKLHINGANSLLKFIEEPQSQVNIFLLAETEAGILPTIRSRCQLFHFPKNQVLIFDELEKAGLLRSQAQLLSDLCSNVEEALTLAKSQHFIDLLSLCEHWVKKLLAKDKSVYLLTAKLAQALGDKAEQENIFELLTLLLAKSLPDQAAQTRLSQLLKAKSMWQANVSFQNALEYMILD